jgi:hypothetical protein
LLVFNSPFSLAAGALDRGVWIVSSEGVEVGKNVEFRLETLPTNEKHGIPIGKIALLSQGVVHRSVVRLKELDLKTGVIRATLEKITLDAELKPGSLATLTYKTVIEGQPTSVEPVVKKENRPTRRKQGERLGDVGIFLGVSPVRYLESLRPGLNAWYLSVAGWGEWSPAEDRFWGARVEFNTEALPFHSELDATVLGETSTFARFLRGNAAAFFRVLDTASDWKAFVRPGFSASTMLVSNPRFGYYNLTGLAFGISVQRLPREGRKIYFDATYEMMNVTTFTLTPSNLGLDLRAGMSISSLGSGELDAFVRYRLVGVVIDQVEVGQTNFDIGLGYRW